MQRSARFLSSSLLIIGCGTPKKVWAPWEIAAADIRRSAVVLDLSDTTEFRDLKKLESVLKSKRIVLLGENGHGVREFTAHKACVVRFLHERLGFHAIAFESPYDDCVRANAAIDSIGSIRAAQSCLLVQLQHAEMRPLFDYIRNTRRTPNPLAFAGIDLQISLFSARARPGVIRARVHDHAIASELARLDSTLIEATFKGADTTQAWIQSNGKRMVALIDSAVATGGEDLKWVLATERALVERLMLRTGAVSPVSYYESRDQWMANTVRWLADSTGGRKKVAVWLHNEHGRYGMWQTPSGPAQATGRMLRAWYASDVYSLGLFMGRGRVADNSRRVRDVRGIEPGSVKALLSAIATPAFWVDFSANARLRRWFERSMPYARAGLALDAIALSREFDGVMYIDSVSPPAFGIR